MADVFPIVEVKDHQKLKKTQYLIWIASLGLFSGFGVLLQVKYQHQIRPDIETSFRRMKHL